MVTRSTGEDAYFVASNSAKGFCSYYRECFDDPRIDHLYAIKGGPGTGKSRFLREVAQYAEKIGSQSEYIYCSSDPDSLDGVIITHKGRCLALLDATAPHIYEPSRPGVREDLINLGAFWSIDALSERAEQIEHLNQEKGKAYRRAYRYLSAMGETESNKIELISPYIRRASISRLAQRLMREVEPENAFSVQPALMRSLGMKGGVAFDTYFANAKKIYLIEDCRTAAQYLMAELLRLASELRLKIRVSHDPILPDQIDGIFLSSSKIAFVIGKTEDCTYPHRHIGMRRFVETAKMKTVRTKINYAERLSKALLQGAIEELERVREIHFALEELYIAAMDFSAKEVFTKSFCQSLFGLQSE